MLILTNIKFALQSLWNSKSRSFLTMLGVIIGVFSVIVLMSIGEGVRQEFTKQIMNIGSNLVIATSSQIDTEGKEFNPISMAGVSTLTMDDVAAIKNSVANIEKIAWITNISGTLKQGETISRSSIIFASQADLLLVTDSKIREGRFISEQDNIDKNRVMVLGDKAKKILFGEANAVLDKKISLLNEEFTVIGVLEEKESATAFGDTSFNNMVIIPFSTGEDITKTTSIFRILMKINSPENVASAVQQTKAAILAQHDNTEDFSVLTQQDLLGLFDKFLGILEKAISGIAAISLVVGGIGIMNIMLVAVTERTKEIGIRKALGANAFNILTQFLIEAVTLSLLGGIIGIALAYLASFIIRQYFAIPIEINANSLVLAFTISFSVGIIFGLMPAIKASRKNPIEALRYE